MLHLHLSFGPLTADHLFPVDADTLKPLPPTPEAAPRIKQDVFALFNVILAEETIEILVVDMSPYVHGGQHPDVPLRPLLGDHDQWFGYAMAMTRSLTPTPVRIDLICEM